MALRAAGRGRKQKPIAARLRGVQLPALDAALLTAALQLASLQGDVAVKLIQQEVEQGVDPCITGGQLAASQPLQAAIGAAHVAFDAAVDLFDGALAGRRLPAAAAEAAFAAWAYTLVPLLMLSHDMTQAAAHGRHLLSQRSRCCAVGGWRSSQTDCARSSCSTSRTSLTRRLRHNCSAA